MITVGIDKAGRVCLTGPLVASAASSVAKVAEALASHDQAADKAESEAK